MCADDTVLLAPYSPTTLQTLVNTIGNCFKDHNLAINVKKTKCMSTEQTCDMNLHVPQFYADGSVIMLPRNIII